MTLFTNLADYSGNGSTKGKLPGNGNIYGFKRYKLWQRKYLDNFVAGNYSYLQLMKKSIKMVNTQNYFLW